MIGELKARARIQGRGTQTDAGWTLSFVLVLPDMLAPERLP
jgi:hypothetical protein